MKKHACLILQLLFPVFLFANDLDTTIQGIPVEFTYSLSIFPVSWQGGSINAGGEQIISEEIQRSKPVIARALNKYPSRLLELNLKAVYFLKSMSFFNIGFGGTNSSDAVYITNNGEIMGYTDYYLEQTFHHEFSSILFRNYPSLFDTIAWKKENIPGFDYNDPESGVGAIKKNETSQNIDEEYAEKGTLTVYAMSGVENDVNTFAQNLFRPAGNFWNIVDRFPRIKRKTKLLIEFYGKLSPFFTEQYFRAFAK